MKITRKLRRKLGLAIAWSPARDSYFIVASMRRSASSIAPLYVSQAAILATKTHVRGGQSAVPFGLLTGAACVCPRTKVEYLLIDEAAPAGIELTPDEPEAQLTSALRALSADAERRGKLVLGWYLGGMDEDLQLDADLQRVHEELFPEPWQLVMVRSGGSNADHGALLRYESISDHFYSLPFSELLPDSARAGPTGELPTAVSWTTYRTEQTVEAVGARGTIDSATSTQRSSGAEVSPLRAWMGAFRAGLKLPGPRALPAPPHAPAPWAGQPSPRIESSNSVKRNELTVEAPVAQAANVAGPIDSPAQPDIEDVPVRRNDPHRAESSVVQPHDTGASRVARSEPAEAPVEMVFPVLPQSPSSETSLLPKVKRERVVAAGIAFVMLMEALWLLRVLR